MYSGAKEEDFGEAQTMEESTVILIGSQMAICSLEMGCVRCP